MSFSTDLITYTLWVNLHRPEENFACKLFSYSYIIGLFICGDIKGTLWVISVVLKREANKNSLTSILLIHLIIKD